MKRAAVQFGAAATVNKMLETILTFAGAWIADMIRSLVSDWRSNKAAERAGRIAAERDALVEAVRRSQSAKHIESELNREIDFQKIIDLL